MPPGVSQPDPALPILLRRAEIESAIARHQIVVICGETGSGKTTQLPQLCLALGRGKAGMIGHTQPRRLAARAVAARIAEEMGVRVGGVVGVKVRFQDQTARDTKIKLMTDGMLLAELAGDPKLAAYDTIIIDEAHERSLNIDFLLGCLRDLLPKRPDLKLIITSATIDPARFSDYFGGPSVAPVLEVSGRMFPVEVRYDTAGAGDDDWESHLAHRVADAAEELCRPSKPPGDVLVFLPGEREIRAADKLLKQRGIDADILPLLARLTNEEQDRIFHPGPRRRVILSTNIAETSLTVPRIRYVIDSGLVRLSRYDAKRKVQTLPIEPISQASAKQRAGRCGRVAEGVCVRLYSESALRDQPAFTEPEIRRSSLASVILQMKSLGLGAIEQFPLLDPPDSGAVRDGYETLFELGAITRAASDGALTEIGRQLSKLPVDPRVGRMLLGAEREGSLREVLVLAAALSIQDVRERPMSRQEEADRAHLVFRNETSDFLTLLNIWDQYHHAAGERSSGPLFSWCRENFLSAARMREWIETHYQLRDLARELELRTNQQPAAPDQIHRALLTGLISHVACRTGEAGSFDYRGIRGNTLTIFPGSVLFKKAPKWIMAGEVVQTTKLFARTVARIEPEWIEELAAHVFQRQITDPHWDSESQQPGAWERISMSGVVVVPRRRVALAAHDPAAARRLFIADGLLGGKWGSGEPFMRQNREALARAARAEAKLRRRGVTAPPEQLAAWFDARLPKHVCDPASFGAWWRDAARDHARRLELNDTDVLLPAVREMLDSALFPDEIELATESRETIALEYALAPGKDEDGVTATVRVAQLPMLTSERAAWLVPGNLADLVLALMKTLPKSERAKVETKGDLGAIASECAGVIEFARGPIGAAISEAIEVLHGVTIPPGAWSVNALPAHLRLRVRVVDDAGKELGVGRDLAKLMQRFEGRIRKAQSANARRTFEREGVTSWDFGDIPAEITIEHAGEPITLHPAAVDRLASVSLELHESAARAESLTRLGVRRLFAIAIREEIDHYLTTLPQWGEMVRHYANYGNAKQLGDDLSCVVADRVFLIGQPSVRTKGEFDGRSSAHWGRLSSVTRETAEIVAKILEPRARVAHRISGGTPRLWAASVADIREQAAYLVPAGFVRNTPWERLREFPRYVQGMRERLFALREDGSGSESAALARFAPYWKAFTGWVAARMSDERRSAEQSEMDQPPKPGAKKSSVLPLPAARRRGVVVNLDAGEWAQQPGAIPPTVAELRWTLEELRLALFVSGNAAEAARLESTATRLIREIHAAT